MDDDGQYLGRGGGHSLVLRVDVGGSGVISADIFRDTDYLTSTRTRSGQRVESATGSWAADFSTDQPTTGSGTVPGTITIAHGLEPTSELTVAIRPDVELAGLPAGEDVVVTVRRQSTELRELGLEIEREDGVDAPQPTEFAGMRVDERECFRRAGFAVSAVGAPTQIPRQVEPWDYSRMFTLLHDVMTAKGESNLSVAAWELHLLLLSSCTNSLLNGVMFDAAGVLPRQGSAVFLDTIRRHAAAHGEDPDRNAVRTIVQQIHRARTP